LIQFGIANVVATLGTALTPAHLRVLGRLSKRIVCFFDGDNAGRRAALRGFAVCAEAGTWAQGAFLPDGEDPDSFVRRQGADAVRAILGQAVPLTEFYFQQARAQAGPGMPERAQVAQDTMRIIATVKDPIERDLLLRTAGARLGVGEDALRAALRRAPQRAAESAQPAAAARPKPLEPRAEVLLLESMVADEGIARTVALRGVIEQFANLDLANAARELVASWEREGQAIAALDSLHPEVAARLRETLLAEDTGHEQRLQQAEDCVRRIEADAERPLLYAASQELAEASSSGDVERERELLRRKADKLRGQTRGAG
jgi:DNA primase